MQPRRNVLFSAVLMLAAAGGSGSSDGCQYNPVILSSPQESEEQTAQQPSDHPRTQQDRSGGQNHADTQQRNDDLPVFTSTWETVEIPTEAQELGSPEEAAIPGGDLAREVDSHSDGRLRLTHFLKTGEEPRKGGAERLVYYNAWMTFEETCYWVPDGRATQAASQGILSFASAPFEEVYRIRTGGGMQPFSPEAFKYRAYMVGVGGDTIFLEGYLVYKKRGADMEFMTFHMEYPHLEGYKKHLEEMVESQ